MQHHVDKLRIKQYGPRHVFSSNFLIPIAVN
jgi:hypothetical protein